MLHFKGIATVVTGRSEKIRKSQDYKLLHVEVEVSYKYLLYFSVIRV